jgi:hypothetical protein
MKPGGGGGGEGSSSFLPDLMARCFGGATAEAKRLGLLDVFFLVHAPLLKLGLLFPFGEERFRVSRAGLSGESS